MKGVILGCIAGTSCLAIGDLLPWDNPMLIQCGALTILAWTLYYLMAKIIPMLIKAVQQEQKSNRKAMRKLSKAINKLAKK